MNLDVMKDKCPVCDSEFQDHMEGHTSGFNIYQCCPECGSIRGRGSGSSISCKKGHNIILSDHIKCDDCGWEGKYSDIILQEEYINNKRFEKLNDILCQ
jgi:hypothetical protein